MTTAHSEVDVSAGAIKIEAPTAASNVSRGIVCMIIATIAFAVTHALSKWLVASYPVGQVMFSRSLVGFAACAAFLLPIYGTSVFTTKDSGSTLGARPVAVHLADIFGAGI